MEEKQKRIYDHFLNKKVLVDVQDKNIPVVGVLIDYSQDGIVVRLHNGKLVGIPESKVLSCKGEEGTVSKNEKNIH